MSARWMASTRSQSGSSTADHQPASASAVRSTYSSGVRRAVGESGWCVRSCSRSARATSRSVRRSSSNCSSGCVGRGLGVGARMSGSQDACRCSVSRCSRSNSGCLGTSRRSRWWSRCAFGKTTACTLAEVSHTASVAKRTRARSATSTSIRITRSVWSRSVLRRKVRPVPKGLPRVGSLRACAPCRSPTPPVPNTSRCARSPTPRPGRTTCWSRCTRSGSRSPTCSSAEVSTSSSPSCPSPSASTSPAWWSPGRASSPASGWPASGRTATRPSSPSAPPTRCSRCPTRCRSRRARRCR